MTDVRISEEKQPWYKRLLIAANNTVPVVGQLSRQAEVAAGRVPTLLQSPEQAAEPKYGLSGLVSGLGTVGNDINRTYFNLSDQLGRFISSEAPSDRPLLGDRMYDPQAIYDVNPNLETDRAASAALRGRLAPAQREALSARQEAAAEEGTGEMTFQDYLDMYGGSFNSQPYDDYMNYLAQQDTDTYNRIQAMYAKLADDAGANVERIKDIYGGAEQGVGQAYEGAKGTTEAAYASAQQQAADQLARLGIAEAAPAVIDPMALSQAEAVSNLAASEGAGQSAVTQRGATSRDFASQMAQVGQQQGLEATAQILREMGQRQAEAAFQRAQAEASYNPYEQAMQRMQSEQAFYAPALEQQAAQMDAAQRAAELQRDNTLARQDKLVQLWSEIRKDYKSDEEAWAAAQMAISQAEAQYPIF